MKKKFEVSGMSCAACQANVTRAVAKLDGVKAVTVSLLAKNMVVEFDEAQVSEQQIMDAVAASGYGACPFVNQSLKVLQERKKQDLRKKRNRLLVSLVFLALLMGVAMGSMIAMRFVVIKVGAWSVRRDIDRDIMANPVDEIVAIARFRDDFTRDIVSFIGRDGA